MNDKKLFLQQVPHEWVPSTLGHGDAMCKWCVGTNRELAVVGKMDHCETRAALDPKYQPGRETMAATMFQARTDIPFKDLMLQMAEHRVSLAEVPFGQIVATIIISPLAKQQGLRAVIENFMRGQ